jgi:hypothetical protein
MAVRFMMRNEKSGIQKDGFYGFSWTTLFFGPLVNLFRGDFLTFIGSFAVFFICFWALPVYVGSFPVLVTALLIFHVIWSFSYNSYYTKKLLEKEYQFAGTAEQNEEAAKVLKVKISKKSLDQNIIYSNNTFEKYDVVNNVVRNLDDDAYKIHLVKKYPVEFNDVLGKHIFNEKLYDSIDDVLSAMHEVELNNIDDFRKIVEIERGKLKDKIESLKKEAQPYLDLILTNDYNLLGESVVDDSIVWDFQVTPNGLKFEIKSIEELKIFTKNF